MVSRSVNFSIKLLKNNDKIFSEKMIFDAVPQ